MRALGVDLGDRRIGVAISDPSGAVATPYEVVQRRGDRSSDHAALARLVDEVEAEVVVVGLPLSLDGRTGPAARATLEETEELRRVLPVPVESHDERLTTVSAERSLQELDLRGPARRRVVDKVAATVMLQSWLDARAAAQRGTAG